MFLNSAKRTRNDCLARPFRKGYGVFHVCPVLARRPCNSALPLRGPVVSFMASEAVCERLPAFGYRPPAESEAQKPEKGARLTGSEPYTVSCFQGTYRQPLRTSAPRKGTEITSVLLLHRLLRAGLSAIRLLLSKRLLSLLSERRPRGL